jgi:hypothetical protein
MSPRIDHRDFLDAFSQVVADLVADSKLYSNSSLWTQRMCGNGAATGVIPEIANKLKQKVPELLHRTQWYTLDAVLVAYPADVSSYRLGYPPFIHCIIEHENGDNWHEEVWKLAHWRAPLKVLIVYDFNEDLKTSPRRVTWVDERIAELRSFLQATDSLQGKDGSEFLLIVGSKRAGHDDRVNWRSCLLNHHDDLLRPIPDLPARAARSEP